ALDDVALDLAKGSFQVEPVLGDLPRLEHRAERVQGREVAPRRLRRDGAGQVLGLDPCALREEHDPLEEIPELADVPRPGIGQEELLRARIDRLERLPELAIELREEMAR